MRTAALGATCFVAVSVLSGCAGSGGVSQSKPAAPVVVVSNAEAAKKPKDNPKAVTNLEAEEAKVAGILGALGAIKGDGSGSSLEDLLEGGVVGGVINSDGSVGLGGFGLKGVGVGGGGRAEGIGGFGMIGLLGNPKAASGSSDGVVKAKFGQVVVTGPLTVDIVQRYVDEHRNDVQACHKLEQERSGTRWGTITLLFTIDPTGHVSNVVVSESSIYSKDLESCIAHVTGSFEFPAPRTGDVTVLLPITF